MATVEKEIAKAPSPFFEGTQLQFAWDSTSLGYLKTCPRYYQLSILEGWRNNHESVHLTFGGHYAKALERYHIFRHEGMDYEDAVDRVIDMLLQETWNRETDTPWESDNTKKNRHTLVRTVVWYLENFREDPAETLIVNGAPAVELTFKFESGIIAPNGSEYLFTGHLDRLVSYLGMTYVQDQKTTSSALGAYYFKNFAPDNQMSLYTFASQVVFNTPVAGVMIDAAQVIVGSSVFGRGITLRTPEQIEEWHHDTEMWLSMAEKYADRQHWPQNDKACSNYGGCQFRDICSLDPRVRPSFLESNFTRRYWNPLEVR